MSMTYFDPVESSLQPKQQGKNEKEFEVWWKLMSVKSFFLTAKKKDKKESQRSISKCLSGSH